MTKNIKNSLIVALDVGSFSEARQLVQRLKDKPVIFKVGLSLFTAVGPDVVKMIHDEGRQVFLDLKFHDIPNTVASACESALKLGVYLLDVHASGGRAMLEAAASVVKNAGGKTNLIGVTVLTSQSASTEDVLKLAGLCRESGLSGIVCSPQEASLVRKQCGTDFLIVTPGIRPLSKDQNSKDDQVRTATAGQAIQAGADFIVVGRPILSASDPVAVVDALIQEIEAAKH